MFSLVEKEYLRGKLLDRLDVLKS